jgi:hypothetical protein
MLLRPLRGLIAFAHRFPRLAPWATVCHALRALPLPTCFALLPACTGRGRAESASHRGKLRPQGWKPAAEEAATLTKGRQPGREGVRLKD